MTTAIAYVFVPPTAAQIGLSVAKAFGRTIDPTMVEVAEMGEYVTDESSEMWDLVRSLRDLFGIVTISRETEEGCSWSQVVSAEGMDDLIDLMCPKSEKPLDEDSFSLEDLVIE